VIINLRGTNGSGKSTVARALLAGREPIDLAPYVTPGGEKRAVLGHRVPSLNLIVVGPYRTVCGGCDAIKTQDLVCESVRMAAGMARHVFFEGVIVSTLFTRYLELSRELGGLTWAYLDTPPDVCLRRIQERNGGKAIKVDLVMAKTRSIEATRLKAIAHRERVETVPHERAVEVVREMLD
jgi:gluconate kinase